MTEMHPSHREGDERPDAQASEADAADDATVSHDSLDRLRTLLDQLAETPVEQHADALEEVHRGLLAELDAIAGSVDFAGTEREG